MALATCLSKYVACTIIVYTCVAVIYTCICNMLLFLQMAFSYVWMQVIPRVFEKTPVAAVQAVQNMLLGRKR